MNKKRWLELALVLALTLVVFLPTLGYDFVNLDDSKVVLENSLVQEGLNPEMIAEAFTTPQIGGQYVPMTMISLAANQSISGSDAWSYHLFNLILHLLNVILVYALMLRLLRKDWMAGLIALLFAIHPMHVEPVAWVSSRKDVLYLFFMLSAWWMYLGYLGGGKRKWIYYGLAVVLMLVSVFSKSAGIVLPFVLLLTDYLLRRKGLRQVVLEKLPFLAISLIFAWIGYAAQKTGGAVTEMADQGWFESVFYASTAFLTYLFKALVPTGLAAFHPYPAALGESLPWYVWASLAPAVALVGLSVWLGRKNREFAFGAGVFVVSIIPFLQLVPVGPSLTAERFTYFPYLGLFVLIGLGLEWAGRKLLGIGPNDPKWKPILLGISLPLLVASMVQVGSWQNGETLWSQVIRVHPTSGEAHVNRAAYYLANGQTQKAMDDLNRAIKVQPGFPGAYINRGMVYFEQQNFPQALADFNRSLELDPEQPIVYMNRGLIHMNTGMNERAMQDFDRSLELDPSSFKAYYNRGFLHGIRGEFDLAVADFDQAAALAPGNALILKDRAMAHHLLKNYPKAIQDYSAAIAIDPAFGEAYLGRSHSYYESGDLPKAKADALRARELGLRVPQDYLQSLGL